MIRTDDLDFQLPADLVATRPADPRDAARMLVVSRSDPARLEHRIVRDMPALLEPRDLLVMNDTRVARARLTGVRADTRGRVEGLFLEERVREAPGPVWTVLLRSNGALRAGQALELSRAGDPCALRLELLEREGEAWIARTLPDDPGASTESLLERVGATPLPPYIATARRAARVDIDDAEDRAWYQTVYASAPAAGSVAAPTAGLHFTPELLAALDARGVARARLTLHVGRGTFKPIQTETLEAHEMHAEWIHVPAATIEQVRTAPRVIAVGTTTVRALESLPDDAGPDDFASSTSLLIAPGHAWRRVDALMTNFHLPRSTLLALVAALFPEGIDRVKDIYREAIARRYRFFSYGDSMLILP